MASSSGVSFSGIASGIDSTAIIQAASDATRAIRVTPNKNKIDELDSENSKLTDLKTKLTDLQTLAKNFTTISGGGVKKSAQSTDETIVKGTAGNAAVNGTYALTVTQLAKNATVTLARSSGAYTSSTDPVNGLINASMNPAASAANRTITVSTGTGSDLETVAIELDADTTTTDKPSTLDEYVTKFNNTATKAVASVVNVGSSASPDYRVMIVSSNPGLSKGQIAISVGSEITGAGSGGFNSNTTSQATDATLTMSGVSGTITRSSNTFSDLVPNLTFNLLSTGSATITVADDVAATSSGIQDFVDKFNEIVKFINDNNQVTRDETGKEPVNVFAPLSKTTIDDNAISAIRTNISSASSVSGSAVKILADIGIQTQEDGTLKFLSTDPTYPNLTTALSAEPNSVRQVLESFGDAVALTGGTIDQYIQFQGLIDTAVTDNTTTITDLNDRIARAEELITQSEDSMKQRFASLEALTGRLQGQAQALTSSLAGLR